LQEFTIQGKGPGKVLVVPIRGVISDVPGKGLFYSKPSLVQEVISQLRLAEQDKDIKAVVFKIDSPGGSITASDILYHEITGFKRRTGVKVVVAMMGLAASGGYYISLPADFILAHPTTVTGSIGVIFLGPNVSGLMDKIGVDLEITKSGPNKDMGSPFRDATEQEKAIFKGLIVELADRFLDLVTTHRKLDDDMLKEIASARVFLANEAVRFGLVDSIGYLDDAVLKARNLAGLSEDAKTVVYRRTEYPDDNLYNTFTNRSPYGSLSLVYTGLNNMVHGLTPGFHYLWLPASGTY
jgi:protease-4